MKYEIVVVGHGSSPFVLFEFETRDEAFRLFEAARRIHARLYPGECLQLWVNGVVRFKLI